MVFSNREKNGRNLSAFWHSILILRRIAVLAYIVQYDKTDDKKGQIYLKYADAFLYKLQPLAKYNVHAMSSQKYLLTFAYKSEPSQLKLKTFQSFVIFPY